MKYVRGMLRSLDSDSLGSSQSISTNIRLFLVVYISTPSYSKPRTFRISELLQIAVIDEIYFRFPTRVRFIMRLALIIKLLTKAHEAFY